MSALERDIPPGTPVLVDTSSVIAYIGGGDPASEAARQLFDVFAATGRNPLAISAVTVTELLVRPFQRGPETVEVAEGFLRHFADIRVVDIDFDVAREAARIRAATGLRTPDALVLASAAVSGARVVVTTDPSWQARLRAEGQPFDVVTLGSSDTRDGG